ncbi:hypothetical protein Tco_1519636, partial [Tanacetum coccineum]
SFEKTGKLTFVDFSYAKRLRLPSIEHLLSKSKNLLSQSFRDLNVRDNSITELKNQLAEALREKDDLKLKLEKFETSSMKLTKLINSQISVNNKSGVGFDSQMNENELHDCHLNKREVFESASDSSVNEIEEENNQVNDRFNKVKGYHACVYVCVYVDYVGIDTQSIERDRLIGIGVVLDNSFRSLLCDGEMIIEI